MSFYNEKMAAAAKAAYPEGTRIYIEFVSGGSYSNAVGHYGTVEFVDDIGQVFCRMDNGTHATVCKEYGDSFFKVESEVTDNE